MANEAHHAGGLAAPERRRLGARRPRLHSARSRAARLALLDDLEQASDEADVVRLRPAASRHSPQTRAGRWWEAHPRLLRLLASITLLWGLAYLGFRLLATGRGADPVAFYALWLVEAYNFASLAFLAYFGWRWHLPVRPGATPGHTVDVFVTTYNEPVEVLEATLAGCDGLRYPHRTYVLDDGRRLEIAVLAQRWGAGYLTRPDNRHAKAGNINHALGETAGELVFCLDADHVPMPDALDALVGYFDDERVAVVQTPHDFYNQDSVQHYEVGRHEQSLFFEVVCPGKDRHNGVFWCGSAALIRREALIEAGGVSTETIAEDFHSTVKMHRLGWRTRYHDEVVVQGLAPLDLDGYLLQRDRWARGNLAVFRLPESPLGRRSGLSLAQRASYFGNLFAYGAGLARITMIVLIVVTLGLGVLPARLGMLSLGVLWLPFTVLAVTSSVALCRGHLRARESSFFTLLTAEIFTRALRCAVLPSRAKFKVTPKAGADTGGLRSLARLRIVLLLAAGLVASIAWRAAALAGAVRARPLPPWAATLALVLGCWELFRIAQTTRLVAKRRQRREHVRFECAASAIVTDRAGRHEYGRVVDVAVSGAGLVVSEELVPGEPLHLSLTLDDHDGRPLPVSADAVVRSVRADDRGGWRVGTSFLGTDDTSHDNLVRYCYVAHAFARLREIPARGGEAPTPLRARGELLASGTAARLELARAAEAEAGRR